MTAFGPDKASVAPAEYKYDVLAGVLSKAKELRRRLHALESKLEECEDMEWELGSISPDNLASKEQSIDTMLARLDSVLAEVKGALYMGYSALSKPDTFGGKRNLYEALLSDDYAKTSAVFDLKLEMDEQKILLKLPLLWSKYGTHGGMPPQYIAKGYWMWFGNELEALFHKKEADIPVFHRSHFSYIHVLKPKGFGYPDNDNYDTKFITDKVISWLGGTDGPLQVSFSSMSFVSENLEEGTYLVVTPNYNSGPDLETIRQWLNAAFSVCKNRQ